MGKCLLEQQNVQQQQQQQQQRQRRISKQKTRKSGRFHQHAIDYLVFGVDVSEGDVHLAHLPSQGCGVRCRHLQLNAVRLLPALHVAGVLVENLPSIHLFLREGLDLQRAPSHHRDQLALKVKGEGSGIDSSAVVIYVSIYLLKGYSPVNATGSPQGCSLD